MRIAVLGTGIMGTGMARSLLRSGLDVTVWNRTPGRAAPLAADGAHVAGSPAEAVADVDAVITMLWDGDSVADVMADALPAAPDGVLWVQASTVSLHDAGDLLPALADGCGARYIDAPVLGTRQPAEEGRLTVLAAAPEPLRDLITPVFGAIAARTVWVSERPGDGTRLKLVANSWVATIVAATAQSIAFAQGLGLDPRVFLDMMKGGAVDAPYLHIKGEAIIAGQFATSFAVDGAVKDTGLIAAAMREGGTDATLMDAVAGQYRKASDAGHGEADMAAIYHAFRLLLALSMRRNASTVVVLPGPAPAEVLAAADRSMNVALIRPAEAEDPAGDGIETAAGALRRAGRSSSSYAGARRPARGDGGQLAGDVGRVAAGGFGRVRAGGGQGPWRVAVRPVRAARLLPDPGRRCCPSWRPSW